MNVKRIIKSFSDEIWNIGFFQNDIKSILAGDEIQVKWMKHSCKNSWFADPFILEGTDNEIHVLVEEFYKPIHRGRISRLIIDRKSLELKKKDVVLELNSHLSFPAILRIDGNIYIYPENGESGELNLYRYNLETNECVKMNTVLPEAVADAVMTKIDGKEYLFCTKQPEPNGNVLYEYVKNDNEIYVESRQYKFQENVARMAGDFFTFEGRLYRPTQECNVQYGHAVTLQEVIQEKGGLGFREVRRMYSSHPKLNVGMHTFNIYKGLIVTDALGFENMWFRNILQFMRII